jgi:sialidase-1
VTAIDGELHFSSSDARLDVGCCRIVSPTLTLAALFLFASAASTQDGFEGVTPGPLGSATTDLGRWKAAKGHATIDAAHAKSGSQCLHITGGDEHRVVLTREPGSADVSELSFWAERWTAREPFEFRVERYAKGKWREIYRGDDEVVIGGFKTHVRIPVDAAVDRLRMTCTSPSGVLIDDLRLGRLAPMELISVKGAQPVTPCLVGRNENTIAEVRIETSGALEPLIIAELQVALSATGLDDVDAVEVLDAEGNRLGDALPAAAELVFRGERPLLEGTNTLRIAVSLSSDADLDLTLAASCARVRFTNGVELKPDAPVPRSQRLGLALRDAGDDGAAVYRIPGLTTTPAGTLIAVYDVRWNGWRDLPGDIDVGMSRSVDGGRTWEPMRVILDMGSDAQHSYDGVGDAAVLVDRANGAIWVAAIWSHGERGWNGSGPGLSPDETGQLMLVKSEDDGLTWSAPINITEQVKRPEWCFLLQGPGGGISMRDGTLVFAAQYQDTPERGRTPHSTVLYSRDHGASWQLGTGAKPNTTEAQVVELEDGVLMLNMRDNRGGSRAVYTTRDLGQTWSEHPTSRGALIEPVCNAALVDAGDGKLVFVNPAVPRAPRRRMTLKLSTDRGTSWPEANQLLLDEGQSAGYPALSMIDAETVGILFEGSRAHLTFMRIPLDALQP